MRQFPFDDSITTIAIAPDSRVLGRPSTCMHGDGEYVDVVYPCVIGLSALWAYKRFLRELAAMPGEIQLSVDELAASIGVSRRKMVETINRLVNFHIVRWDGSELLVPGLLPTVRGKALTKLSESARQFHDRTVRPLGRAS